MKTLALLLPFITLGLTLTSSQAITIGQIDDFQGGTVQSWLEGPTSPNPPEVFPDDGPLGIGDHYLENASSGAGGAGSKLAMFNRDQWSGDFRNAGVKRVTLDAANFGGAPISLRLGLQSADNSTRWVSTDAILLTVGTDWIPIEFSLTEASMQRVLGTLSLNQTLLDVNEMRFVNRSFNAGWVADTGPAVLAVDNITAVPEATPLVLVLLGMGLIGVLVQVRRARGSR